MTCQNKRGGPRTDPALDRAKQDFREYIKENRIVKPDMKVFKMFFSAKMMSAHWAALTRCRSRSGRLAPFIAGVHRYLNMPGLQVVPLAVIGTQAIMPVGARCVRPGPVSLSFSTPIAVNEESPSKHSLERAYHQISRLLPPSHRPLSGQAPVG